MNSRVRAFTTHFFCSSILVGSLILINYLIWYPPPIADLQGANNIFFLIVVVDLLIGPLIILIIYDKEKKSLKFDIAAVIIFQIVALAFGAHATFVARPVYAVFYGDRFEIAAASEISPDTTEHALNPYQKVPLGKITWVGAILPSGDVTAKNDMLFSALMGGGLRVTPKYYVNYSQIRDTVRERAKHVDQKLLDDPRSSGLKEYVSSLKYSTNEIGLVPIKGSVKYGTVVINLATGNIISYSAIDPWWY